MKIIRRTFALGALLIGTAASALATPQPLILPDGGSTAGLFVAAVAALLFARSRLAGRK
jgi:hypothetical protein